MNKFLLIILLLTNFSVFSQRFYDSTDLKYYIDFSSNFANLRFDKYRINGPIEEIESFYRNKFTLVKGDSIHWMLGQSENKKNKYLSYLIIKGDYKKLRKLARREASSKKFEIIMSDKINSGYFRDHFNFVSEIEYEKINRDKQVGEYINDAGLVGIFNIEIFRNNNINYQELDIQGVIEITKKEIRLESNLPTLTSFVGVYDSELNEDISFINRGIISGRGKNDNLTIFTMNINLKNNTGSLTIISVKIYEDGLKLNKRETTTFLISRKD
tara:strand:+ start:267 stop:1079 length:813 start_codon:yes stop_codon:yes gene_type:complete